MAPFYLTPPQNSWKASSESIRSRPENYKLPESLDSPACRGLGPNLYGAVVWQQSEVKGHSFRFQYVLVYNL